MALRKVFGFGGRERKAEFLWQDKTIHFDLSPALRQPTRGERVLDVIDGVEDTKGNEGVEGRLVLTNLRVVWHASADADGNNVSVGWAPVTGIASRSVKSVLRGSTLAVQLMTTYSGARFEFVFTASARAAPRLMQRVRAAHRGYASSRLYREIRLRGAFLEGGGGGGSGGSAGSGTAGGGSEGYGDGSGSRDLALMRGEQPLAKVPGVRNLSGGKLGGTLWLTSVRAVWCAAFQESFNVSLPLCQVQSIAARDTRAGRAIVVEVHKQAGGYKMGFQVDDPAVMDALLRRLGEVWRAFLAAPAYDGAGTGEAQQQDGEGGQGMEGGGEVAGSSYVNAHQPDDSTGSGGAGISGELSAAPDGGRGSGDDGVLHLYYAFANKAYDLAPAYNAELGLAVEGGGARGGDGGSGGAVLSMRSLWHV